MNSQDIITVLRQRYGRAEKGWVFFEELRLGTGWKDRLNPTVEQRLDGWAMNTWPSNMQRLAFEIKVTAQDFKRELENPSKREAAKQVSTAFYFVCPAKLIWYWECPEDAGLIWVDGSKLKTVVPAPTIETVEPSWRFIASLARRIQKEKSTTRTL